MKYRCTGIGLLTAMIGLLLPVSSYADKPYIIRGLSPFDFLVADCGDFEVWTSGSLRETKKLWFDDSGNPVRQQWAINIVESRYYNNNEPDKYLTQGKSGIGENLTWDFDFITGDWRQSGAGFRLTIPGIGHALLDTGTWVWDESEGTFVHHGPNYVLAVGETGLALCEALE